MMYPIYKRKNANLSGKLLFKFVLIPKKKTMKVRQILMTMAPATSLDDLDTF